MFVVLPCFYADGKKLSLQAKYLASLGDLKLTQKCAAGEAQTVPSCDDKNHFAIDTEETLHNKRRVRLDAFTVWAFWRCARQDAVNINASILAGPDSGADAQAVEAGVKWSAVRLLTGELESPVGTGVLEGAEVDLVVRRDGAVAARRGTRQCSCRRAN